MLLCVCVCVCCCNPVIQIPSDLISYDPANSATGAQATVAQKLDAVKGHVKQIEGMVRATLRALFTP